MEKWTDFYVAAKQLLLLSKVMATQHGVQSSRTKWMQNVVSRVDLDTTIPVSRLIPLDMQYLEAAMNAGDEGQQYLQGQPGGKPVMLTSVGAVPLAVSIGYLKGRNTLRITEVTEDLAVFTEEYDERRAKLARENARQQKKTAREASKERKQVMVREGDIDAMMAVAMKQAATPPVLEVDALLRGRVQFRNLDGTHTSLVVFNRDTGEELLKKEYEDGIIDEYVNFGRYKLPLEKFGVVISSISGEILEDLTPEISL